MAESYHDVFLPSSSRIDKFFLKTVNFFYFAPSFRQNSGTSDTVRQNCRRDLTIGPPRTGPLISSGQPNSAGKCQSPSSLLKLFGLWYNEETVMQLHSVRSDQDACGREIITNPVLRVQI